jgi:4-hydroxy-4-methyl-2-oxoglutarate aldolase
MAEKQTLGKLPRDAIRLLELPRLPAATLEGFSALVDLTGTISDALDELGIVGWCRHTSCPGRERHASSSVPRSPCATFSAPRRSTKRRRKKTNTQGETEAHNLAEPGDVLVIEGVMGCSNMGGQSATIARRQGFAGAVVDGTLRDPEQYRGMGWPVWCRGFTPITGKWRMQTVEVNGTVEICGVQVRPGDHRVRRRGRSVLRAAGSRP